jgi:hypothetical protein
MVPKLDRILPVVILKHMLLGILDIRMGLNLRLGFKRDLS